MFSSQNLIPCFLTFCSTIESKIQSLLTFLNFKFFIILVCLLLYMLSINNNLSAGTQNVTGAYVIIMLAYRRLLTTRLHDKAAVR